MEEISEFRIVGLFGKSDVTLSIHQNKIILVGPNGIGKSSVVSIFYLFLSRQWSRLIDYNFLELSIIIGGEQISARREEITGLSEMKRISRDFPPDSRISRMVNRFNEAGLLEKFLNTNRFTTLDRRQFADILNIPLTEVQSFQRALHRRMSTEADLLPFPRVPLEHTLAAKYLEEFCICLLSGVLKRRARCLSRI